MALCWRSMCSRHRVGPLCPVPLSPSPLVPWVPVKLSPSPLVPWVPVKLSLSPLCPSPLIPVLWVPVPLSPSPLCPSPLIPVLWVPVTCRVRIGLGLDLELVDSGIGTHGRRFPVCPSPIVSQPHGNGTQWDWYNETGKQMDRPHWIPKPKLTRCHLVCRVSEKLSVSRGRQLSVFHVIIHYVFAYKYAHFVAHNCLCLIYVTV